MISRARSRTGFGRTPMEGSQIMSKSRFRMDKLQGKTWSITVQIWSFPVILVAILRIKKNHRGFHVCDCGLHFPLSEPAVALASHAHITTTKYLLAVALFFLVKHVMYISWIISCFLFFQSWRVCRKISSPKSTAIHHSMVCPLKVGCTQHISWALPWKIMFERTRPSQYLT